jgi:hypothetical protein
MALCPFKKCEKEIGGSAKTWPNCGKNVGDGVGTETGCIVIVLVLIVVGVLRVSLLKGVSADGSGQAQTKPQAAKQPSARVTYQIRRTIRKNSDARKVVRGPIVSSVRRIHAPQVADRAKSALHGSA